jgi:branched-chain amino acid aminotransferase
MKATDYVFLNGRIVDAARASVSVYDRGVLYGDGLFETMRAYKGVAFAIEEHFHRLRTSADILGLPIPNLDWPGAISALLERNGLERHDAWVRLTVTRGPAEPRVLPPDLPKPTTIMMVRPVDREIAEHQKRGVKVALLPFSCHGFIPEHKSLNYLPAVLGKVLASYHGAYEGLFVRTDHILSEGTTSSVFIVRDGTLWTTPERPACRRARDHHHRSAPGRRGVPDLVDDRGRADRPGR